MLVSLRGRVTENFVRFIAVVIAEYVKRGNLRQDYSNSHFERCDM